VERGGGDYSRRDRFAASIATFVFPLYRRNAPRSDGPREMAGEESGEDEGRQEERNGMVARH